MGMDMRTLGAAAALLAVLLFPGPATASEPVSFSYEVGGDVVPLRGQLYRPERREPAPAVVLMHGCAGIWSLQREWAERFAAWGYVALVLDSFGPRGVKAVCAELGRGAPHKGNAAARAFDAYAAAGYLAGLDFVDPERIALVGWSHGAGVALTVASGSAVNAALIAPAPPGHPRPIVAFYPWCSPIGRVTAPLLILIGESDDWTPAARCRSLVEGQRLLGDPVELVVYPGATHSFDGTEIGPGFVSYGHRLRHDPAATRDAVERVRAFLAMHLGG